MITTGSDKKAGKLFSSTGLLFKDSEKAGDLRERIKKASENFNEICEIETDALNELSKSVSS